MACRDFQPELSEQVLRKAALIPRFLFQSRDCDYHPSSGSAFHNFITLDRKGNPLDVLTVTFAFGPIKRVLTSCRGLFCFLTENFVYLCNPATHSIIQLPPVDYRRVDSGGVYGIGYVKSTGEYKVVRLGYKRANEYSYYSRECELEPSVFTYPTTGNCWRALSYECRPYFFDHRNNSQLSSSSSSPILINSEPGILQNQSTIHQSMAVTRSQPQQPELVLSTLLPQRFVANILLRLPPKSLFRFMSVSRSWMAVISSRSFQNRYYAIRAASIPCFLFQSRDCDYHPPSGSAFHDFVTLDRKGNPLDVLTVTVAFGPIKRVLTSCSRLFCFPTENFVYLCNPATHSIIQLPPVDYRRVDSGGVYGIGYVKSTGEYKVEAQ
ncbi:F-box protein At3g07870 [Linum perenne]